MKHSWILAAIFLGTSACATTGAGTTPAPATQDEPAAATADAGPAPARQEMVCYEYTPTGSRIPRRRCVPRRAMKSERDAGKRLIESYQHRSSFSDRKGN